MGFPTRACREPTSEEPRKQSLRLVKEVSLSMSWKMESFPGEQSGRQDGSVGRGSWAPGRPYGLCGWRRGRDRRACGQCPHGAGDGRKGLEGAPFCQEAAGGLCGPWGRGAVMALGLPARQGAGGAGAGGGRAAYHRGSCGHLAFGVA